MKRRNYSRREFIKENSPAGLGAAVALGMAPAFLAHRAGDPSTPAILGGRKIRTKRWPEWPMDDIAAAIERIHKNADKLKNHE